MINEAQVPQIAMAAPQDLGSLNATPTPQMGLMGSTWTQDSMLD